MTSLDQLQVNRFMPRFPCLDNGDHTPRDKASAIHARVLPNSPFSARVGGGAAQVPPRAQENQQRPALGEELRRKYFQEVGSREGTQRTAADFCHRLDSSPVTS